ncbi:MAG: endonuclease/exonuclease/phosphatase family protein, partial [Myxococcales bacterium]|nr:endonuclease/exonuclease/phosphatase family protein [Myxococcales bacterium]
NGHKVGTDKWRYKLEWYGRLASWLAAHDKDQPLVLCGDFNIAPTNKDVANLEEFEGSVLFNPEIVAKLEALLEWGLSDVFRIHRPDDDAYSWWDYRRGGFERNNGMRIDLILTSKPVTDNAVASFIDVDERQPESDQEGTHLIGEKPSDHAPVLLAFKPVEKNLVQGALL